MNDEVQLINLKDLFDLAPSANSTALDIFSIHAYPDPEAMEQFVDEVCHCGYTEAGQNIGLGLYDETREMFEDLFFKLVNKRRRITREDLIWDTICWYSEEILHEDRATKGWTVPELGVVEAKAFAKFVKNWLEKKVIPGEVTQFSAAFYRRIGPNQIPANSVFEYKAPEE